MESYKNIRYFDKDTLMKAANIAEERNYNRQLDVKKLEENLDATKVFPVMFSMIHDHAEAQLVDPHIRTMVALSETETGYLDVDMDIFKDLPSMDLPEEDQDSPEEK